MKNLTAQKLCSNWHGGQWSALYQFASSGQFVPANSLRYLFEIRQTMYENETCLHPFIRSKKDSNDLIRLYEYFENLCFENMIATKLVKDEYGFLYPTLIYSMYEVDPVYKSI